MTGRSVKSPEDKFFLTYKDYEHKRNHRIVKGGILRNKKRRDKES